MLIKEPEILLFDIETMPNLVRTWRKWEQNAIWYERYGYLWSISWKYLNKKKVYHKNITDFKLYKKDKYSDKALVEFIWDLINNADIVIAHNGNAFDLKAIYGRFIHYRLPPPNTVKKIDTKLLYKKYLNEDSNSLKDIAEKHGLTHKLSTGGEELWRKCELGDKNAIKKMAEYNNGDVITLEEAYKLILPYVENHPNLNLYLGTTHHCPNCGSFDVVKDGFRFTNTSKVQKYRCKNCKAYSSGNKMLK